MICLEETDSPSRASPFGSNSHAALFSFSSPALGPGVGIPYVSPWFAIASLLKPRVLRGRGESFGLTCPLSHREILNIQNQALQAGGVCLTISY